MATQFFLVMLFLDIAFKLELAASQDPFHSKGKLVLFYFLRVNLFHPRGFNAQACLCIILYCW